MVSESFSSAMGFWRKISLPFLSSTRGGLSGFSEEVAVSSGRGWCQTEAADEWELDRIRSATESLLEKKEIDLSSRTLRAVVEEARTRNHDARAESRLTMAASFFQVKSNQKGPNQSQKHTVEQENQPWVEK